MIICECHIKNIKYIKTEIEFYFTILLKESIEHFSQILFTTSLNDTTLKSLKKQLNYFLLIYTLAQRKPQNITM